MAHKVTKEQFDAAKGLNIKTDQPFVKPKVAAHRKLALQEAAVRKSLHNVTVPVYNEEDIAFGIATAPIMGMAKINPNLTVTLRFTEEKWKRMLTAVKAKKKFDKWWTLDYCGRCFTKEDSSRVMQIEYLKLRPNVETFIVPDVSLFDVLAEELEKTFPKNECKERGAAVVLVAQAFIRIKDALSSYYGRDIFLTEFLKRGNDDPFID